VAIAAQSEFEQAKAELESATAAADILIAEIKAERDQNFTHIEQLRKVIDLDLIKLYDKIKSDQGGIGAAKLVDKTCDGCRLELSSTDLSAIKASDVEEVIRCDNCRRILVR
jgi:predicted  nucleic acid-binding Zn-ribbon protein